MMIVFQLMSTDGWECVGVFEALNCKISSELLQ